MDWLLLQLKMATYPWQEQLFKSHSNMVLLNCSRQAGKSTCVAFLALLEALTIQEHLTQTAWSPELEKRLGSRKVGGVDFGFTNPFAELLVFYPSLRFGDFLLEP